MARTTRRDDEDALDPVEAADVEADDPDEQDGFSDEDDEDEDAFDDDLDEEELEEQLDDELEAEPTDPDDPDELDAAALVDAAELPVPSVDVAFDEDDDLVAVAAVDDEDDEIDGVRAGEFVCRSCFMAKRETQLADAARQLCRDCA